MIQQKPVKCWKSIGVFGDATCAELQEYHHCKHCPVYFDSARHFFNREIPNTFIDEWTKVVAQTKEEGELNELALIVFRVGREWFGINSKVLLEAVENHAPHYVPFRSNNIFRGLVNIKGELLLSFDLSTLTEAKETNEDENKSRMLILSTGGARYVFTVTEISGLVKINRSQILPPPLTLSRSGLSLSDGILVNEGTEISVLNEEKLAEFFENGLKG